MAIRVLDGKIGVGEQRRLLSCLRQIRTFAESARRSPGCVGIDDPRIVGTQGQDALVQFDDAFDCRKLPTEELAIEVERIFETF